MTMHVARLEKPSFSEREIDLVIETTLAGMRRFAEMDNARMQGLHSLAEKHREDLPKPYYIPYFPENGRLSKDDVTQASEALRITLKEVLRDSDPPQAIQKALKGPLYTAGWQNLYSTHLELVRDVLEQQKSKNQSGSIQGGL